MKLIERYVHDVARRLPEKQRHDVAMELTAEIEEMAKDRKKGRRPTEQDAYDVLVELGSPSSLADQYRERPRYLIGPDYYEPYISILKTILLVALPLVAFIVWMNESLTTNHTVESILLKVVGALLETTVHIIFWTTMSIAFVQKVAAGQRHDHNWKPEDLPPLPSGQEITRNESYFAIAWSVFAVLASLFQIPAVYSWLGPDDVPQFFSESMWPYWTLGLLSLSLIGLFSEIIKLIVRGWTKVTVIMAAVINIITVTFFLSLIAFVHPIVNPELMNLIAESLNRPDISQSVHTGIIIFVYIIVAICIWEVVEAIYKYRKGGKQ